MHIPKSRSREMGEVGGSEFHATAEGEEADEEVLEGDNNSRRMLLGSAPAKFHVRDLSFDKFVSETSLLFFNCTDFFAS